MAIYSVSGGYTKETVGLFTTVNGIAKPINQLHTSVDGADKLLFEHSGPIDSDIHHFEYRLLNEMYFGYRDPGTMDVTMYKDESGNNKVYETRQAIIDKFCGFKRLSGSTDSTIKYFDIDYRKTVYITFDLYLIRNDGTKVLARKLVNGTTELSKSMFSMVRYYGFSNSTKELLVNAGVISSIQDSFSFRGAARFNYYWQYDASSSANTGLYGQNWINKTSLEHDTTLRLRPSVLSFDTHPEYNNGDISFYFGWSVSKVNNVDITADKMIDVPGVACEVGIQGGTHTWIDGKAYPLYINTTDLEPVTREW